MTIFLQTAPELLMTGKYGTPSGIIASTVEDGNPHPQFPASNQFVELFPAVHVDRALTAMGLGAITTPHPAEDGIVLLIT